MGLTGGVVVVPGLLKFSFVQNQGVSFGLFGGGEARWLLSVFSIVVAAGLAYNGSESYGVELASRVQTWRRLLAGATDDVEPYQPGVVKPKGNDLKKMAAA